jgi:hypothetical protein
MIKYITVKLPEGHFLKLVFTRMTEQDNWICQMEDSLMSDVQKIIGKDVYGPF